MEYLLLGTKSKLYKHYKLVSSKSSREFFFIPYSVVKIVSQRTMNQHIYTKEY